MCTRTASTGSSCASADITTPPLASGPRQSSQTPTSHRRRRRRPTATAYDTVPPCTNPLCRRPVAGRCWSSPAPAAAAPACSPGLTGRLGVHIPKPEVSANRSNPRGFGEPRWLVDYHNELLVAGRRRHRGRPSRGLGADRQGRRATRGPRPAGELARDAVRGERPDRGEGPTSRVVLRAPPGRGRTARRRGPRRDHAATPRRGDALARDRLRHQDQQHHPRRRAG